MPTLLEMLSERPLPQLRGLAERRGVTLTTGQRGSAAEQLAAALATPESVQAAVSALSEEARAVLHRLLRGQGRLPLATFIRVAGPLRTFGMAALETAAPWRHPLSAAEELWYSGLIGRAFEHTEHGVVEFAFIPTDILPLLPLPEPDATSPLMLAPSDAPKHLWRASETLLDDACTLLIAVYQRAPRLVGTAWRRGDLAALRRELLEPDLLPLLLHLAERLGWTEVKNRRLRLAGERVRAWLEQTRWEQARSLFEAWRDDPHWNDLHQVPGLRWIEASRPNDDRQARLAILRHMAQMVAATAADRWWRMADFIAAVHEVAPDFQRPDGDYDAWYIQDEATGEYLRGFSSWWRVEGALIHYLLTGPLRALGVVQAGADEADASSASHFTVTPLGRWLLGIAGQPQEPTPASLVVRDDFTVVLPAGYALLDRFRVARFAVRLSDTAPPPWRYRLERATLLAAARKGLSPQQVLDYLQQTSSQPVPDKVVNVLRRLAAPTTARARWVILVEPDAVLRAYLRTTPTLAALVADTLPDGRLLVRASDWQRFEEGLRTLGVQVTLNDDA